MASKAPLRVVEAEEKPTSRRKKLLSVSEAADKDRRTLLVSLRARLAKDIDSPNTPARDLAALSRRLLEIAKDIDAIDAHDEGDEVGDAAATPDEEWATS